MNIRLQGVVVHNRRSKFRLGSVDAVLGRGMHVVIGPNGSGKSSLLQVISNLYAPAEGKVIYEMDGRLPTTFEVKLRMGYVPQELAIYEEMTLHQYLHYIAVLKCLETSTITHEIERVTAKVSLSNVLTKKRLGELSVGQQRRAMIAQALLGSPCFLVLDEPYVGLDLEQRRVLHYYLQEYSAQAVIVVASHYVEEFKDGDYDTIVELRDGNATIIHSSSLDRNMLQL